MGGQIVNGLNANYVPPAEEITERGWQVADNRADSAFASALGFIGALSEFTIPFTPVASGFATPSVGYTLTLPDAPAPPVLSVPVFADPGALVLPGIAPVVPEVAPVFTAALPVIGIEDRPLPLSAVPPGSPPTVADVVLPAVPVIIFPDAPLAELVRLPAAPSLLLPVFGGVSPDTSDIPVTPGVGVAFREDYYDSPLIRGVTDRLMDSLLGGTGLPVAIETAIWDRARTREQITARRTQQETVEAFASRGFSLPTGALAARMLEVEESTREKENALSRDIAIKQAELEVENLRFAVTSGLQLESQWMSYRAGYYQRSLDAARITADVALSVFNAQIAIYNARLSSYQTEAQVYRDVLQAETVKLDQYRAQIEAQRLVSEINVNAVQAYRVRVDALLSSVEVYRAQLDGVRATVDVDRARIEGFRESVSAYRARVDAKSAEYQAWAEGIRGETSKVQVYEAQSNAYRNLVDAYRTRESVKTDNLRADIDKNRQVIDAFQAKVQYLAEQVRAANTTLDSTTRVYDAQARVYASQIGGEEARIRALVEQTRLSISAGTADAELKLKAADVNIQQLIRIGEAERASTQAAGSVAGQLAASAMSSFNLSASISSSWGRSIGNSLSESHSYEEK